MTTRRGVHYELSASAKELLFLQRMADGFCPTGYAHFNQNAADMVLDSKNTDLHLKTDFCI